MAKNESSFDSKLKLLGEKSNSLLELHKIQVNQVKLIKSKFLSLKDYFSSEFNIVINEVTNLIVEASKSKLNNNEKPENKEIDSEESPASMLSNKFRNDEIFTKLQTCEKSWTFYSLNDPMILNQIYKLRINEYNRSTNDYAIVVGVSIQKYCKLVCGSLNKQYGYIVKNGKKCLIDGSKFQYAEKANEGDIIGVSLSIANEDKYYLEIFKNGTNLGIAFLIPIQDYYFCYALCSDTSIEISDCYSHYTN